MLLLLSPAIKAQMPFYTDDTEVTALGTLHIESFDEIDALQSSQYPDLRQNTANFKLNVGLPFLWGRSSNDGPHRDQMQAMIGTQYAVGSNVTLCLGLVAGEFTASPRIGAQLGIEVDFPGLLGRSTRVAQDLDEARSPMRPGEAQRP
ncbi:MAG TPA: hypothetical protein VMF64_08820 [Steroidobacteraceae bacterium]|nr:hypothetical protein [Steroidobacteraceae bacterium]